MVPQTIDPVPVDGRHPDAHCESVSYRLRVSSVGSRRSSRPAGEPGDPAVKTPRHRVTGRRGPPLENAAQKANDAPS
jgi:hypothetical protein